MHKNLVNSNTIARVPPIKAERTSKQRQEFSGPQKAVDEHWAVHTTNVFSDSFDSFDSPTLSSFRGELDADVTILTDPVQDSERTKETPKECNFTTFKTPALPKKVRDSNISEESHLDINFQLGDQPEENTEETEFGGQSVDNPLYLTLNECLTGSDDIPIYENDLSDTSDDHIYENVDNDHILYDILPSSPRPKRPPKPDHFRQSALKLLTSRICPEKQLINNSNSTNDIKVRRIDGSETSDLGSSGSEDAISEEDWPLPPSPPQTAEPIEFDSPLPPPPPEIALEHLEQCVNAEELKRISNKESSCENKSNTTEIEPPETKDLPISDKECLYPISRANSDAKTLKRKISTINKGLKTYKEAIKKKQDPKDIPSQEISPDTEDSILTSIKHSVIIELKSNESKKSKKNPPTKVDKSLDNSEAPKPAVSISKEDSNLEDLVKKNVSTVSVCIEKDQPSKYFSLNISRTLTSDQVIEISDDGSWEMKENRRNTTSQINKNAANHDIDPFTGQPIMVNTFLNEEADTILKESLLKEETDKSLSSVHISPTSELNNPNKGELFEVSPVAISSKPPNIMFTLPKKAEPAKTNDDIINEINIPHAEEENGITVDNNMNSMKELEVTPDTSKNLGAAIMAVYERDINKKKEKLNLPELSMLEFGETAAKDLEVERKSVIQQMTVKAKRKDSWLQQFPAAIVTSMAKPSKEKLKRANSFSDDTSLRSNIAQTAQLGEQTPHKSTTKIVVASGAKQNGSKLIEKTGQQSKKLVAASGNKKQSPKKTKGDKPRNRQRAATAEISFDPKMIATLDDGGWETVANVQFQTVPSLHTEEDKTPVMVPPPPEFSVDDSPQKVENILPVKDTSRPSRQYVYGEEEHVSGVKVVESNGIKGTSLSHENFIEAEIREQKLREDTIRRQRSTDEGCLQQKQKGDRVSSPSSHTSDEGFVDRPPQEDVGEAYAPRMAAKTNADAAGYASKTCGVNGLPIVSTSEAKIAIEIRELREREAELRAMRDIQKKQILIAPSEEEYERSSSSSREATDDHLASLTTTTDEGNFSECGDHVSSEDKSSDGSNSRIMSPDLLPYGSAEMRQRRIIVKPFEDDDVDDQPPVYTRMKNESVIEREIRMANEREEAYRKEKGLLPIDAPVPVKSSHTSQLKSSVITVNPKKPLSNSNSITSSITSSIIQQEIEEDSRKERELRSSSHINKPLAEDTFKTKQENPPKKKLTDNNSKEDSAVTPLSVNTSKDDFNRYQHRSPPSPNYQFTPSPPSRPPPAQNRLIRSFSTTNLSAPFPAGNLSNGLRPPKGLMQKFIASKGKITAQTFVSAMQPVPKPSGAIYTRSMSLKPKMSVAKNETIERNIPTGKIASRIYKRTQLTAEEKIQEELRDMKKREEELKRLRTNSFGPRSHLADAGSDDEYDEDADSCTLPEINSLRTALSNPNLLDCDQPIVNSDKQARRKSVLIAQWEDRIQQTNES